MIRPFPRYSLRIYLLALSVLILELAFTRIFSFITFHHLTYLVVSVAMLGFGAAGTYLSTRDRVAKDDSDDKFLARNAGLMGTTAMGSVIVIPRIHFYPTDIIKYGDYSNLLSLLLIMVVTAAPFFFGGVSIAYIISRSGSRINRIYFSDLVGAATGCLVSLLVINYIGGVAACFVSAAVSLLVATASSTDRRRFYLIGLLFAVLAVPAAAHPRVIPLYAPPEKQMFRLEPFIEKVSWHVITRLDVGKPIDCYCSFGGGLSFNYKGKAQKARLIFQDASNLTGIIQPTPTPRETPSLGYYMQGLPYKIKRNADALVIGCGGGVDVLIALFHKARHVTAIDVNPKMIEMVRNDYRSFSGNLFHRPDVKAIVSEGRHFLARCDRSFDVIQLSGVDTWSALSTGAFALTENLIYTSEAFDQYLAHLKPDGVLNFSRPFTAVPLETIKLATTSISALERLGIKQPDRHIYILAGLGQYANGKWAQMLVKRSPFTPEETQLLSSWTQSLGFEVIYDPYGVRQDEWNDLLRAPNAVRSSIIQKYPYYIAPATDDSPFFFQQQTWSDFFSLHPKAPRSVAMVVLITGLVQAFFLSGLLILYPLYRRRSPYAKKGGRTSVFFLFASIGLGFIMIEMALLQRLTVFMGGPAYSLSVTLFVILFFSGVGSYVSRTIAQRPLKLIAIVIPMVSLLVFATSFLLDHALLRFIYLPLIQRSLIVVGLLSPMGLLMGMPFPAGLRYVNDIRPELNAWAWGINACATVVGSYICTLISTSLGFRAALMLGAVCYLVGWAFFLGSSKLGLGLESRVKA